MGGNEDFGGIGDNVEYYRHFRGRLDRVGAVRGEAARPADYAEDKPDDDEGLKESKMDGTEWRDS